MLREHLGAKHKRFTDPQRLRLALKGKAVGRKALQSICTLATPETILPWYRRLVACKYDGSKRTSWKLLISAPPRVVGSSTNAPQPARETRDGRTPVGTCHTAWTAKLDRQLGAV